jgi:putative membrane protein
MRKSIFVAAFAAATLAGCAASDMAPAPAAAMGDMTPEDRTGYVGMAAASDLFEIQSSQLALSRAQSSAVRDFAQMLVTHHTQTTQQLTAAAQASGMAPPAPMLPPPVQRMMDELQGASGANFERVYLRQQIPAHEMALALHSNYAERGDTPALRAVAAAAVPIVQQHLDRARQLNQ